jgi:hypothetical protein
MFGRFHRIEKTVDAPSYPGTVTFSHGTSAGSKEAVVNFVGSTPGDALDEMVIATKRYVDSIRGTVNEAVLHDADAFVSCGYWSYQYGRTPQEYGSGSRGTFNDVVQTVGHYRTMSLQNTFVRAESDAVVRRNIRFSERMNDSDDAAISTRLLWDATEEELAYSPAFSAVRYLSEAIPRFEAAIA